MDKMWLRDSKATPKKAAKKTTKKRARTAKGEFVKDDPTTDENEAWVETEE